MRVGPAKTAWCLALAGALLACAAVAGACPSLSAVGQAAPDAPPTVEAEFSLFRLSFLDIWADDIRQSRSTDRVYERLAEICPVAEARLLFTLRTGDVPPTRIHMFVSVPAGKPADDFARSVRGAPFSPESAVRIERVSGDSLDVELEFRDRRGRREAVELKLQAWELADPRRTEAFQIPFRKAGNLLGYLSARHGRCLRVLDGAQVRRYRLRVRCPDDDRYHDVRRSAAAERRARQGHEDVPTGRRR